MNIEDHFTGNALTIDPAKPFRLEVVIDNQDGGEHPDNPWTLNAYVGARMALDMEYLILEGGGALIEGTIPEQLRALADAIENGSVER
jgi:hypothetical protein